MSHIVSIYDPISEHKRSYSATGPDDVFTGTYVDRNGKPRDIFSESESTPEEVGLLKP